MIHSEDDAVLDEQIFNDLSRLSSRHRERAVNLKTNGDPDGALRELKLFTDAEKLLFDFGAFLKSKSKSQSEV